MFDETQSKIIQATMDLVMERGYASTTTKDIASRAGINECTIFRKFKGKKEIVLSAMQLPQWNPKLSEDQFSYVGDLERDLCNFSQVYMEKVTPRMVKVSMGLRTPELYPDTAEGILEVPRVFKGVLVKYFTKMQDQLCETDAESMAMMFLSMNFGFVFFGRFFWAEIDRAGKRGIYCKQCSHFCGGYKEKVIVSGRKESHTTLFLTNMQVNTCIERRENDLFYSNCNER